MSAKELKVINPWDEPARAILPMPDAFPAWTGVKYTGCGATLSHYGLLQLTQLKSMHLRVEPPN